MKVLISDVVEWHAALMLTSLSAGYGSDLAAETVTRIGKGLAADLEYAKLNNISLVVRSITGLYPTLAASYYPGVLLVMPLGSNDPVEITTPTSVPVIVCTGAGDDANETAYGPALEFFAADPTSEDPSADASSFSNGYIAGQLLKIKEGKSCPWWNVRYSARMTASGGGTRTDADGYGKIDVTAAIAYTTTIPDPYYQIPEGLPLGITSTTKTAVDALTLDPANTESSFVNHATHHDTLHTAVQELYDRYRFEAKFTQTSTSAPVISTEKENNTGRTLTPGYEAEGIYSFTFSGATFLTASNVRVSVMSELSEARIPAATRIDGTSVWVYFFDHAGAAINGNTFWLSIEVFL